MCHQVGDTSVSNTFGSGGPQRGHGVLILNWNRREILSKALLLVAFPLRLLREIFDLYFCAVQRIFSFIAMHHFLEDRMMFDQLLKQNEEMLKSMQSMMNLDAFEKAMKPMSDLLELQRSMLESLAEEQTQLSTEMMADALKKRVPFASANRCLN